MKLKTIASLLFIVLVIVSIVCCEKYLYEYMVSHPTAKQIENRKRAEETRKKEDKELAEDILKEENKEIETLMRLSHKDLAILVVALESENPYICDMEDLYDKLKSHKEYRRDLYKTLNE